MFLGISQNSQQNTCATVSFLKRCKTLAQVFYCDVFEISKNTFFYRTPPIAASEHENTSFLYKRVCLSESMFKTFLFLSRRWWTSNCFLFIKSFCVGKLGCLQNQFSERSGYTLKNYFKILLSGSHNHFPFFVCFTSLLLYIFSW